MKAVLCKEWGGPETLAFGDVEPPSPGPGEIKVAVKAAGVNFADTLMIAGTYQVKPQGLGQGDYALPSKKAQVSEKATQDIRRRRHYVYGYVVDANPDLPCKSRQTQREGRWDHISHGRSKDAEPSEN